MDNLYQTPSAELLVEEPAQGGFFVTSTGKLYLLYFLTLGIYSIYWFYKHWDSQRAAMRPKRIWPAARSIVQIFFVHSLCRLIAGRLRAQGLGEWKYSLVAWLYILLVFGSNGLSGLDGRVGVPLELLLLMVSSILPAWPLAAIQERANLVSGDPTGQSNRRISGLNLLCIVPGAALWLLIVVAYFL